MCGIISKLHKPIQIGGRGGQIPWSPDLTPLDYFLWGSMKSVVYGSPLTSEGDLIARVHGAIENLTRQTALIGSCV